LIAAKLAGTKAEDGSHAYMFRDNETAAYVALIEVGDWLRAEAVKLRKMPDDIDQTGRSIRLIKADALLSLADSLTRKDTP